MKARREISEYLAMGKEDRARIRVEHIIREDYVVEAMELIEMYCDLLLARMGLIQSSKLVYIRNVNVVVPLHTSYRRYVPSHLCPKSLMSQILWTICPKNKMLSNS